MAAVGLVPMTADEASLEAGIRVAHDAMLKASTPQAKRLAFRLLADLHARRSPEMVERMERERGLR